LAKPLGQLLEIQFLQGDTSARSIPRAPGGRKGDKRSSTVRRRFNLLWAPNVG
jgi:hypothetical protein